MKKTNKDLPAKAYAKPSGVGKTILSTLALIVVFVVSLFILIGIASPKKLRETKQINQVFTVIDSEGGSYFGPVIDMAYQGVGEFQYLAGGFYEGEFSDSTRSGEGTFQWENGDSFVGTWSEDQMLKGSYTFANGSYYSGDFKDNLFENGTFYLSDKALGGGVKSLSATFENGTIASVQFETTSGISYKGAVNGKADIQYKNGDKYSGNVSNGVRNGNGKYTWVDSSGKVTASYDGSWKDDQMSGNGTYYYSSSSFPYIRGTFKNGKPDGKAVYYKEADNTFDTVWSNGICTEVTES